MKISGFVIVDTKRKVLKVLKIEFDIKGIELECNM